jgi:hypothetical protein
LFPTLQNSETKYLWKGAVSSSKPNTKQIESNSTNKMNRITISWNQYQIFLQTLMLMLLMLELLLEPQLQS